MKQNDNKKSVKGDGGKKVLSQKLDTRTPEEIKREQEILLWMGDIRDEFILEAEDYKQYQKDKKVPSYFIVGGTLAAAAAICTAIFFQTGHNRFWKDNDPMQLPYQTEETKETEWESETKEETSEELSTEESVTEENTTEMVDSIEGQLVNETNDVNVVNGVAASTDSGWLAQSQNYRILAQTDENTVSVYYAWDGSLQCTFSGKLASGTNGCLAKVGDRVPIINGQTVALQMYVVGEKQLSQEMYVYWNQLSDTVFTSSDSTLFSPGKLYTINGVLLDEKDQTFVRVGDHIYSQNGVYDLEGQFLGSHQEFTALQEFGNYVLGCDYTTWTYLMFDLDTMATVWTSSDRDWTYQYSTGQSINWTMSDGQGIVTDLMRNPKLTEADWIAQNADWTLNGNELSILYENEQTKESIVRLIEKDPTTDLRSYRYYRCDEQYHIVEELPTTMIDSVVDGVQIPLTWSLTDDGMLVFTNIWTKEELVSIPIDLNGGEIESIQINGFDPMYGVTVSTMNPNDMLTFLVSNGTVISQSKDNTIINETVTGLDEKTIVVYENGTMSDVRYFDENGNLLSAEDDAQVVYADQYAACAIQNGTLQIRPRGEAAYQLPIASNQYLAITTGGEDAYAIVLNSSGEEVLHLNGYELVDTDESMNKAMIVDENTPIVIESVNSGDDENTNMGLYSLKNQSWIVEPSNQKLTVLSDNVYAKQSVGSDNVSDLYQLDGSCIEEAAEGVTRQGDYIISKKSVYDLNGQTVFSFRENEQFLTVINTDILLAQYFEDGSHQTRLVDGQGETVWLEESGLTWTAAEDSWNRYTSWLDGNQKGVLLRRTDENQLKTVLTEDEFLAKNASVQGTGMRLLSVTANFDGNLEFFLQTTSNENEEQKYVYHCDSDFTVIDSYSYKEYLEMMDDSADDPLVETDDTVLFVNDDMSCVQEENRIVIKDRAGQVRKEIQIR